MSVIELIEILQNLPPGRQIFVEGGSDKDYDRTSSIKVVRLPDGFLITDEDSKVFKKDGIQQGS